MQKEKTQHIQPKGSLALALYTTYAADEHLQVTERDDLSKKKKEEDKTKQHGQCLADCLHSQRDILEKVQEVRDFEMGR